MGTLETTRLDVSQIAKTIPKNFFKLMNNAPYGKTIENVAKRTNIMLVTDQEKMRKHAEKPHCIDVRVFAENLVGVELRKTKSLINKPFQVGCSNLDSRISFW